MFSLCPFQEQERICVLQKSCGKREHFMEFFFLLLLVILATRAMQRATPPAVSAPKSASNSSGPSLSRSVGASPPRRSQQSGSGGSPSNSQSQPQVFFLVKRILSLYFIDLIKIRSLFRTSGRLYLMEKMKRNNLRTKRFEESRCEPLMLLTYPLARWIK
jgi:hypothetical protein